MSDVLFLYLFTRLDDVRFLLAMMAIALAAAAVGGSTMRFALGGRPSYNSDAENDIRNGMAKENGRVSRWTITLAVACLLLSVATPSKTDMAVIVGGKVAIDAARSDTAKEVAGEVMDAIRRQLKEVGK